MLIDQEYIEFESFFFHFLKFFLFLTLQLMWSMLFQ